MLNIASLGVGAVALLIALVGIVPLFGWLNWFAIPLAVVGLALGVVSQGRGGRNLNLVVIAVGVGRLMLGGGLL